MSEVSKPINREDAYRQVDVLITHYMKSRAETLESLSPESIRSYVEVDEACETSLGRGNIYSYHRCHNCVELGRLYDIRKGYRSVINIESGGYMGHKLSIVETDHAGYSTQIDPEARKRVEKISAIENINKCGLNCTIDFITQSDFLVSEAWLNSMIVNWCVSDIFGKAYIPHVLPIIKGFICKDRGYHVYFGSRNSLLSVDPEEVTEKFVFSLINQLSSFLYTLQDYQFVHGTATIDKMFISSTPCNYQVKGHRIVGDKLLLIDGFHLSSINWKGKRLIASVKGRDVDLDGALNSFRPVISKCNLYRNVCISKESMMEESGKDSSNGPLNESLNGSYLFKYTSSNASLFTTMRYSGYPLFGGAFDVYSFIVSLMTWKPFREVVDRSDKLTTLIRSLFPRDIYGNEAFINSIPLNNTPITCSYKIADILKDRWLYCDSINRLRDACVNYKG